MNTRAKFKCESVTITTWAKTYEFSAVVSGSEENDKFFGTTPAGKLSLTIKGDKVSF